MAVFRMSAATIPTAALLVDGLISLGIAVRVSWGGALGFFVAGAFLLWGLALATHYRNVAARSVLVGRFPTALTWGRRFAGSVFACIAALVCVAYLVAAVTGHRADF